MAECSGSTSNAGVTIEPAESWARWSVRTRAADRAAWEAAYGVSLPSDRLRSSSSDMGVALWLGPDEWMLFMRAPGADAFRARCASTLVNQAPPTSIVEVSHRSLGFQLNGPGAAWALNSGCPLDLSDSAFPVGACTRTLFGKAEVILWRRSETSWHLDCWRSFAPYIRTYLAHAITDEMP